MNSAHWAFAWLFNITYGTKLRDPFTMYKVFRSECIEGVEFVADRFDFDCELAGKLVRLGYKPVEIPVEYNARGFDGGKKVRFFRDPPDLGRRVPPVSLLLSARAASRLTDAEDEASARRGAA